MVEPSEFGGMQPVHVWFTVILAAAGIMAYLGRIAHRIKQLNDIMVKFLMEHEILMTDYAERKGIEVDDLPTRLKGLMSRR